MTVKVTFEVNENPDCMVMSSLKGYISANYRQLCDVFGKPNDLDMEDGDKVYNSWVIEFNHYDAHGQFENVVKASIYDWKEVHPLDSIQAEMYRWHIGGYTKEAEWLVHDALNGNIQQEIVE